MQRRRPEVSAAAALVVERATAKDPAERYQAGRRDDRRPLDRARGRGGAGGLDHRRGDQRARRGAAAEAQALRPRRAGPGRRSSLLLLVAGGGAARGAADQQRQARRRGRRQGQGHAGGDLLGHRLRPRGRRRRGPGSTVELRRRRQPDRDRLEHRALRHRHLRRDQDRPRPRGRPLRDDEVAGDAGEDGGPHPDPGLGRAGLRRRRRGRPANSPDGANRSARSTDADGREEVDLNVAAPAKYFLLWFTKAAPARDQEGRYQVEISDIKLLD